MARKKSCFIIMPISTPENLVDSYKGDKDHFKHVLETLFVPAVKAAGLDPKPPSSKGSEVIHGDIIKNIQSADMLLCDMSALNANVFFELGMRTAANRPVALVKDSATAAEIVPFDIKIINHHTYSSELNVWEIEQEIEKLKSHLEECVENIDGGNSLWTYFSLSAKDAPKAVPLEAGADVEGQLAFMNRQLEGLREEFANVRAIREIVESQARTAQHIGIPTVQSPTDITSEIIKSAVKLGIKVDAIGHDGVTLDVRVFGTSSPIDMASFEGHVKHIARRYRKEPRVTWVKE